MGRQTRRPKIITRFGGFFIGPAMSIRTQIREAAAALVRAAAPSLVYVTASRPVALSVEECPQAFVYLSDPQPSGEYLDDDEYTATLTVTVYVMATNSADAELDQIAALINLEQAQLGVWVTTIDAQGDAYGVDEENTGAASINLDYRITWSENDD